nr:FAD-dependent oxidoreductase [Thauera aminoaromatica]
ALALVAPPGGLLAGHAEGARWRVLRRLAAAGIALHPARARGTPAGLELVDAGRDEPTTLPADCVIAATGAHAPPWTQSSGLACDAAGWVTVDAGHRSVSHPFIHAAGDVCTRADPGFARSGVHAVHAGPVLAANLLAALAGGPASAPVRSYRPRPRSLYLIASGPRHAIASWGRWSAEGRWVWRWKDRIDRGFIARHRRAAIVPV